MEHLDGWWSPVVDVFGLLTICRTMAYLRLDKDNKFDSDWKNEMALVSEGMADQDYCKKMEIEAPITGTS